MISIIDKINEAVREDIANGPKRTYIGASSIGDPCRRKLWYGLNDYDGEPINERLAIMFETGRKLEEMILEYLSTAKRYSFDIMPSMPLRCGSIPEFHGTADAMIFTDEKGCALEIKTAKNSSFNSFKNKGLKAWNEQYYAQVQSYMGMSGANKAILLAINKDTSEMHEELVEYDDIYYQMLKQKASDIIEAKEPPARINNSPLFYLCGMCRFKNICHSEGS